MDLDEVGRYAESLAGVKRKGSAPRPAWYVDDRLVIRLDTPRTLVVRVPMERRDALADAHPGTFGVPPRMERHHKVEVYLDHADRVAVEEAVRLAWAMQRRG